MATRARAVLLVIALLLTLSACGDSQPTSRDIKHKRVNEPVRRDTVSARVGDIRLQAIRIVKPEGTHSAGEDSALFLTIANSGAADRLVAVSSVDARSVVQRDGAKAPESDIDIAIPHGGVTSMQHPAGLHLELVDLKRDLGKRSFVPVTFRFSDAGSVNVSVFVSGVDHPVVSPLPSADATN
jgi:copper(I)-binding protein